MSNKLTMRQVLEDSYKYYTEDPNGRRAVAASGGCLYLTEDGKKCAVGRYMIDGPHQNIDGVFDNHTFENTESILTTQVQGFNSAFWTSLQDWHDSGIYWDTYNNVINKKGQERYEYLLTLFPS
jgi:hypothetical protein